MTVEEAIKRIRQETCAATYMPDFDKEACLKRIEVELEALNILKKHIKPIYAAALHDNGKTTYSLDLYVKDFKDTQSLTIKLSEEEYRKMIATSFVQTLEMRHHTDE